MSFQIPFTSRLLSCLFLTLGGLWNRYLLLATLSLLLCDFWGGVTALSQGQEVVQAQAETTAPAQLHNVRKLFDDRYKHIAASGAIMPANHAELRELIAKARKRFDSMNRDFPDYRCVVTMRENVQGELQEYARRAKLLVRAEPFSVYMKYISPDDIVNREVLYVAGKYNNNLISNRGGTRQNFAHITRALRLDSPLVTNESDHKITEIGMGGIMDQLLKVADIALTLPGIEIGFIEGASIDERSCTVIEIRHAEQTNDFPFYYAQVFVDNQWEIPVRFVCYDWPKDGDPNPELLEEYTYTQIERNVGAGDADFDYLNKNYGFSGKKLIFQ